MLKNWIRLQKSVIGKTFWRKYKMAQNKDTPTPSSFARPPFTIFKEIFHWDSYYFFVLQAFLGYLTSKKTEVISGVASSTEQVVENIYFTFMWIISMIMGQNPLFNYPVAVLLLLNPSPELPCSLNPSGGSFWSSHRLVQVDRIPPRFNFPSGLSPSTDRLVEASVSKSKLTTCWKNWLIRSISTFKIYERQFISTNTTDKFGLVMLLACLKISGK